MKVTAEKTPSEQVVAKAAESFTVTDARGRVIVVKKPGVLAQYRLIETLGASASNETYVAMVLPLIYVAAIDGDTVLPLGRKSEIDALIQRLDEEGLSAVMQCVSDNFAKADPEADRQALKK